MRKNVRSILNNWIVVFVAVIFVEFFSILKNNGHELVKDIDSNIKNSESKMPNVIFSNVTKDLDGIFAQNIYGKNCLIYAWGTFNKVADKKVLYDKEERYTVYKMNNGKLTWNYSGYDLSQGAYNYVKFSEKLKCIGVPLLYVQVPFKVDKYNNALPYGLNDDTNKTVDNFLDIISENDCAYLDLRKTIHAEEMNFDSMFYNTDHHWTPSAGLWATKVITSAIRELCDIKLDEEYLDSSLYEYSVYEDYMFGSQGKRVSLGYAEPEDFILIEPRYNTYLKYEMISSNEEREGTWEQSVIIMDNLVKDYFYGDPGRAYTGDNYGLAKVKNYNSTNDYRILIIKDSFSKVIIPFLSTTCNELYIIDMRTFEGDLCDYIKENKIDAVVVIYNPSTVVNEAFYEF